MKSISLQEIQIATNRSVNPTKKDNFWNRDIRLGPLLPMKDRFDLYQLLASLLQAGLGMLDALEVLEEQESKSKMKALYQNIRTGLQSGLPLSEAFAAQKAYFSNFEVHTLRMGEQGGDMILILKKLAVYYEKRIKLNRKMMQAFSYPIAVIVVAVLVMLFMMTFVVPMFEDIFQRFDAELPPITQFILNAAELIRSSYLLFIITVLGACFAFWQIKSKAWFKNLATKLLIRLPLVGKLIFKLQLSRFCYTFSLLLKAYVSLDQALLLLENVTRFYPLQKCLSPIRQSVIDGNDLFNSMQVHSIFPPLFNRIIKVGEKTARLGDMLENLATKLEEESEAGIGQLTQFLEPILIVVLGLVVAIILIAMYLPMFELSNAIG